MLWKPLALLPRFSLLILIWTIITWLCFLPMRIVLATTLGYLDMDFTLLAPVTQEFQMIIMDTMRLHPYGFSSFLMLGFFGGLLSILFTLGLLPVLSRAMSASMSGQSSNRSITSIMEHWSGSFFPMFWRFLVWVLIAILLISATVMAVLTRNTGRLTLSIVLGEWVLLLSWLANTAVLLGNGDKSSMRVGLILTFKRIYILLPALIFWGLCVALGGYVQWVQNSTNLVGHIPVFFSQLLFFISLYILHAGKFLWLAVHTTNLKTVTVEEPGGYHREPAPPPVRRVFS